MRAWANKPEQTVSLSTSAAPPRAALFVFERSKETDA
jgi:hypothetical protein